MILHNFQCEKVRAESKNMARKIREDVAEEKQRQLRNLEAIKTQELDCWRSHVLEQKNHDYREAIFQVGSAHRAAQKENEQTQAHKMAKTRAQAEKFRQQLRARRSCGQNAGNMNNKEALCRSFSSPKGQSSRHVADKRSLPVKRKKMSKVCFKKLNELCANIDSCSGDSGSDSDTDSSSTLSSCKSPNSSSNGSEECCEEKGTQTVSKGKSRLVQTPAVVLDVQQDSSESVIITCPAEMADTHAKTNRKFCRVVCTSPEPSQAKQKNVDRKAISDSSNAQLSSQKAASSSVNQPAAASKSTKPPRFTAVSDLLRKCPAKECVASICKCTQVDMVNETGTMPTTSPESPKKSQTPRSPKSPRKLSLRKDSVATATAKSPQRSKPTSQTTSPSKEKSEKMAATARSSKSNTEKVSASALKCYNFELFENPVQ